MGNLIRSVVSLSELKNGDTVEVQGELVTVNISQIKYNQFTGLTYRGQPYRNGITKIKFKVPIATGFRYE